MQSSGDLAQWKMADLLSAVAATKQSGKLRLSRREGEAVILFKQGRINYAATRASRETFGGILIAQKKITPRQLETALALQKTLNDKSLGAILVDLNVLSEEAVRNAVREQIAQVVADLLTWDHGHYEFQPMAISWGGYTSLPLSEILPTSDLTTGRPVEKMAFQLQHPPKRTAVPSPVASHLDLLKQISVEIRSPEITGELLTRVLSIAKEVVDRAVLFIVRPDGFQGIGQAGVYLEGTDVTRRIRGLFIGSDRASILQEATDRRAAIQRPLTALAGDAELTAALGGDPTREAISAPLTASGRVLSVLYGDNATSGEPIESITALEMELSETGLRMERGLLSKRQRHYDTLRGPRNRESDSE